MGVLSFYLVSLLRLIFCSCLQRPAVRTYGSWHCGRPTNDQHLWHCRHKRRLRHHRMDRFRVRSLSLGIASILHVSLFIGSSAVLSNMATRCVLGLMSDFLQQKITRFQLS